MQLGQPAYLKNSTDGGGLNRVRIQEGDNIHRVLFGPVRQSLVYYPTLVEDKETGSMVQRMKVIRRPKEGGPLDVLASLEKRIRSSRGEKFTKSSLDPSTKWLYLIIDKESENYPKVEVAEYPYTVYKELVELESATATKDKGKLRQGLIFMWDAIITKSVDPSKSRQFGTSYSVQVDPGNEWSSKVPVSYVGMTAADLGEKLDLKKFFTDEEYIAIEESKIDLEEQGVPDTAEEMKQKLAEFPIYLGATNPNGSYRFPSIEQFQEQLDKLGLDYLEGDSERPTAKKLASVKEEETEATFGDDMEVEGATVVEEEETSTEEEPTKEADKTDEASDEEFPEW
jgi:hypothetical protein